MRTAFTAGGRLRPASVWPVVPSEGFGATRARGGSAPKVPLSAKAGSREGLPGGGCWVRGGGGTPTYVRGSPHAVGTSRPVTAARILPRTFVPFPSQVRMPAGWVSFHRTPPISPDASTLVCPTATESRKALGETRVSRSGPGAFPPPELSLLLL